MWYLYLRKQFQNSSIFHFKKKLNFFPFQMWVSNILTIKGKYSLHLRQYSTPALTETL